MTTRGGVPAGLTLPQTTTLPRTAARLDTSRSVLRLTVLHVLRALTPLRGQLPALPAPRVDTRQQTLRLPVRIA